MKKGRLCPPFLFALLYFFSGFLIEALDITVTPGADIPFGPRLPDGRQYFLVGGGAGLTGEYAIPSIPFLSARGQFDLDILPINSATQSSLTLISLSAGAGAAWAPVPVIDLRLALAGGAGLGLYQSQWQMMPFFSGDILATFLPVPFVGVGIGARYRYYFSILENRTFFNGLSLSLGAAVHFGGIGRKPRVEIRGITVDPVFPVFLNYYEENPVGTITIVNNEPGSISNVRASFFVPQYMDRPKQSAVTPDVPRGQEVQIPLNALFVENILKVTEGAKSTAEIRVSYSFGGAELSVDATRTVVIYYRNAMTWDDDRKAASFVTARDPSVLKFAKSMAGIAREQGPKPVNLALREAAGIFESLELFGMNYMVDPSSSYAEKSQSGGALDFLQFPAQTLAYKSGDCDDLSILFAAMLESVAVETAFITVPGHIFAAFCLGLSREEAVRSFHHIDDLIFTDSAVWVPVEITMVHDGFLKAWAEGAKEWREAVTAGTARLYPIHDAWKVYPPIGIVEGGAEAVPPSAGQFSVRYQEVIGRFVEREIEQDVRRLQDEIRQSGNNPKPVNKLGVLFAQYGQYDKAEKAFLTAAAADNLLAGINLGNLYFVKKDYAKAQEQFTRAYARDQHNISVLLGLSKVSYELENYGSVKEYYRRLEAEDAPLAARYAYLVSRQSDSSRASDQESKEEVVWALQ
jgi:tetratricopeptide (TPR) repeat protein